MYKISRSLDKLSTNATTLITAGIFLVFCITVLPSQSAATEAYIGSAGSPDLSFYYSPDDLYQMAKQFSPSGRSEYVRARFTFDLIFPIVYGAFLATTISWLVRSLSLENIKWDYLNLIPIAGVIFDLLENTTASIVIGRYPKLSPVCALFASVFTSIKWMFVGGSFLFLLALGTWYLFKRVKR